VGGKVGGETTRLTCSRSNRKSEISSGWRFGGSTLPSKFDRKAGRIWHGRSIDRSEKFKVVDVLAARVSRCASRPDEFARSGSPERILQPDPRAQFALHLPQIGLPPFLARARRSYVRTRGTRVA